MIGNNGSSELLDLLFPIGLVYYWQVFDGPEEWLTVYSGWRMSGDEGDRTPDLGIANAALSHLSYIPTYINEAVPGSGFKPALVRRDVVFKLISRSIELDFYHHILTPQVWARGSMVTTDGYSDIFQNLE